MRPENRPAIARTTAMLLATACSLALAACTPSPSTSRGASCFPPPKPEMAALASALNSRDDARIATVLSTLVPEGRAPAAEARERFSHGAPRAPQDRPSAAAIDAAVLAYLDAAERESWWQAGDALSPRDIPYPLRMPADMIRGLVAIAGAFPEHRARALALATNAGDYLLSASRDAGVPYAPFPQWRGREGRLGELSERMATRLERCGRLAENTRNGWFIVAEKPEEYFFDTGRVGEALVELHAATGEARFLAWASAATDWLAAQPISTNFNYNAFPASFHAKAFAATGEPRQWTLAADRLRHGVLPGMIASGPDAGRWIDPHNQRIAYRTIMLRALIDARRAALGAPPPVAEADTAALESAIRLTLAAIEASMAAAGGTTSKGSMIEVYRGLDALAAAGRPIEGGRADVRSMVEAAAAARVFGGREPTPDAATGLYLATLPR